MNLFLFLVNEVAMLLACYAFSDEVLVVGFHGWPEITGTSRILLGLFRGRKDQGYPFPILRRATGIVWDEFVLVSNE